MNDSNDLISRNKAFAEAFNIFLDLKEGVKIDTTYKDKFNPIIKNNLFFGFLAEKRNNQNLSDIEILIGENYLPE